MSQERDILQSGLILIEHGLSDGATGNISVRLADVNRILITPSSRDYRSLTARDLVRIELDSGKFHGRWKPSSEWRLHALVYEARPDVAAIIHHHGTWSSAVAVARKTIPVLIDEAADIGPVRTAPYAASASEELARTIAKELTEGSNAVLLANHGAVALGRDLHEALRRALEVERLAQIYIGAEVIGGAKSLDERAVAASRVFFESYRRPTEKSSTSLVPFAPLGGPVHVRDLVNYSFQAGVTFASLLHSFIVQRIERPVSPPTSTSIR